MRQPHRGQTGWWRCGLVCATLISVLAGCVLQRGVDFGSPLGAPEDIRAIRLYNVNTNLFLTEQQAVLMLPPLGNVTPELRDALQQRLLEAAQNYFTARVVGVSPYGKLAAYINEKNLVPEKGFFNFGEISFLGQLMQGDYIICVWVQAVRQYPPQNVALYMAIVESATSEVVAQLDANMDASEQEVLVSLADYLQRRRARPFSRADLDVMLQSPSEYQAFVASECFRVLTYKFSP